MKLFICQTCNNEMTFNKNDGTLLCPHCNKEINITDYEHPAIGNTGNSEFISDYAKNNIEKTHAINKPNHLFTEKNADYYIPFATDSTDVSNLFGKKLVFLFLKSSFKKILRNNSFRKLYIPIFSHDTTTTGSFNAICTSFDNNKTNYYLNEKEMTNFISNLNTAASSNNLQAEFSSLFPYRFEDAVLLSDKSDTQKDAEFIAPDIPPETYNDTISDFASKLTKNKLNNYTKKFASSYNKEYSTDTQITASHTVYLPVWEIPFNNGLDKIYINGQTKKIIGTLPISKLKLSLAFLAVMTVIFTIINLILFGFFI